MPGTMIEQSFSYTPIERLTRGVPTIDTNHAQVHEGNAFSAHHTFGSVLAGATSYVEIQVPASCYVHFQAATLFGTGYTRLRLVEMVGAGSGGNNLTPVARHRVNPVASALILKTGAVNPAAESVELDDIRAGSPGRSGGRNKIGGATGDDTEWVLNPGTTYLLEVTNLDASSTDITVRAFWYEEEGV